MLYTISEIAVIIFIFEVCSKRTVICSGAVTIRLKKLEYCFTYSIVYKADISALLMFIYIHRLLLFKNAGANAILIRCLLSQINKNVTMWTFSCFGVDIC